VRDGEVSVDIYIMLIAEGFNDVIPTNKSALRHCRRVHTPVQFLLISVFLYFVL